MVVGGHAREPWSVAFEHERQTFDLPALPGTDPGSPTAPSRGGTAVEVVHARCAGIDISKRDAKVCIRIAGAGRRGGAGETVTTWGSVTGQVLALRDHLLDQRVSCVVMEATGDYWKPFYYLLENASFEVLLANARHVKNLPGRKTDVCDAAWLAQLGAHGLVRGSFVPPEPIRRLRDLTRTRTGLTRARFDLVEDRAGVKQRVEKLLERVGLGRGVLIARDPFPQAARRTRRAPLDATGSPRRLPLCGGQRPGGRDVRSVAVPGDRDRFEVEQGFPVRRQWSPPATGGGEASAELRPPPAVPHHQPPGDPMPRERGQGGEGVFADGVPEVGGPSAHDQTQSGQHGRRGLL